MPTVMDRATNAALGAAASDTPFNGRQINIAGFSGFLEFGVAGGAGLTFDCTVGGNALAVGSPMRVGTTYPTTQELDFVNEQVPFGSVITVRITNPTAGALAYYAYIKLSDVPRAS